MCEHTRAPDQGAARVVLRDLITTRGLDAHLREVRSHCRGLGIEMSWVHSPTDRPIASLHVMLDNDHGVAQLSVWAHGVADITLALLERDDDPQVQHIESVTPEGFRALLARCIHLLEHRVVSWSTP